MSARGAMLIGLIAATLAAGRASAAGPAATESALGQNLAGEACRWEAPAAGSADARHVLCGAAAASAGTLLAAPLVVPLPEEPTARQAAILAAARAMPGGLGAGDTMSCGAAEVLGEGGDSLFVPCSLRSNGWPRVFVVEVAGTTLYQADGLPAMLPVLQAAIAAASGHATSVAGAEAAVRLVEAHFPGTLAHAGGADVAADKALVELARLDGAADNFAGAEAAYRRVLEIELRLFGNNAMAVGETLAELALQVSNQGRFDEAAGLFRRAQPIVAAGSVAVRARFASYLALDAANQRKFADALKYAQQASEMRRAELNNAATRSTTGGDGATPPASRGELAHSLRIVSLMAMRLGDLPTAQVAAEEVLRIIGEEPSLPLWWRPEAVAMMAETNARQGRVVPAERQFREALTMTQKLFGDTAPSAYAELALGRFYADQELWPASVDAFRQALAILGRDAVARAAIVPDQIVPFFAAGTALAAQDATARPALDRDMFRASQLISSDVAGRTIARAASRLAADNPALADLVRNAQEAQRQRDGARIERAAETAKPDEQRNPARERVLAASEQDAASRADKLLAQIRSAFPAYAGFADPGPADLADLEHRLAPDEAFLSFVIGTGASYALLVTPEGLSVARLQFDRGGKHEDVTQASLATDVGDLRQAFVPRLGRLPDFDLAASFELYRHLLAPVADRLRRVDHLVVAPSGPLASLPLALLVTEAPRDNAHRDYVNAAWLARRLAVSQIPSARAFLTLRGLARRAAPAAKPFLAVADPAFVGTTQGAGTAASPDAMRALAERCQDNGPVPGDLLRALPPLHETADEVRKVGALLGADAGALLLGAAATESNLRARPLDQYRVLYFATHGLLPGELHCQAEPGLVLSPPATPARSTGDDGLLEASEIAGFKLDADLVVLSACNTAVSGGQFGGAALAGLADAFFNAGARAVLASHWEVSSLSTVKLMTGLFAQLEGGSGLAQALRHAQLSLIADAATAHPFNWAAFTIIGDGAGALPATKATLAPTGKGS